MIFGMCDCERSPLRGKASLLLAVALLACTNEVEQRPPPPTLAEHEAEVIPAVVRHFRDTGHAGPSGSWLIEDRLIVDSPHGPVLDHPASYRATEMSDQLRAELGQLSYGLCGVQDGVACAEAVQQESPASVVAIGSAEDQPECNFPAWVSIARLRHPDGVERYASAVFLACLEQDEQGNWQVANMRLRWAEN